MSSDIVKSDSGRYRVQKQTGCESDMCHSAAVEADRSDILLALQVVRH